MAAEGHTNYRQIFQTVTAFSGFVWFVYFIYFSDSDIYKQPLPAMNAMINDRYDNRSTTDSLQSGNTSRTSPATPDIRTPDVHSKLGDRLVVPPGSKNVTSGQEKLILLWTGFWGHPAWGYKLGNDHFQRKCSYTNCALTTDKSRQGDADLVLFNCRNRFDSFPTERHPRQIYTLYSSEVLNYPELYKFDGHINMTVTYRKDSDLYSPYYKTMYRPNPNAGRYVPKAPFGEKNRSIAWIVSHCDTKSKRELYVRELQKYIDVDIYGKCGKLSCRRGQACLNKMSRKYKFYLSYENNICRDYVTEKFFKTLNYEMIPISLGDANYSADAPPKSFIDTRDFRSPKDLADFLKTLSANQTAYEEYFQWKTNYKVQVSSRPRMLCDLCKILNEGTYRKPAYKLSDWWKSIPCQNNWVPDFLSHLGQ